MADVVSGSYDPGDLYVFKKQSNGTYAKPEKIVDAHGNPVNVGPAIENECLMSSPKAERPTHAKVSSTRTRRSWLSFTVALSCGSSDLRTNSCYESPPFAAPFPDRISAQMSWGNARRFEASALGPGRILVSTCMYLRCDLVRLVHNGTPEKIDLGDATPPGEVRLKVWAELDSGQLFATTDQANDTVLRSVDDGATWEVNWIATDTRVDAGSR